MSYRRDNRSSRSSLLDGLDSLEEGGLRASSSYSSEINEHDNDNAIDTLHDRVSFLKRLTGDIHEEVESHNSMLDRVGNKMDGSRGMMLGTMDRFKKVFEKKSTRKTCSLVGYFTLAFIFIYYLISDISICVYEDRDRLQSAICRVHAVMHSWPSDHGCLDILL